jgi:hypothetical protein
LGRELSYEMRAVRSVNRLHVGNLGPSSIGGDSVKILVDVNTKTMNMYIYKKKINYSVFFSIDMRLWFYSRNGGCYTTVHSP